MKKIGVYAGAFNPFTFGHLGITRQAAEMFDEVIILIAKNPDKAYHIEPETMKRLVEQVVAENNLKNVKVVVYDGATARFAADVKASFLIRGLRNQTDFQYEETMAEVNHRLTGIKTVYFRADSDVGFVSSSVAMDLFNHGEDVIRFLPANIIEYLKRSVTASAAKQSSPGSLRVARDDGEAGAET
jgi:pantetheine-phosphate adenylyltransferase